MFSRENRRPKGAKFKIYLNLRIAGAFVLALSLWRWWCPLVQAFEGAGPDGVPALVLLSCVPLLLSALSLCPWCVALEICLYSHFKGVFSVV